LPIDHEHLPKSLNLSNCDAQRSTGARSAAGPAHNEADRRIRPPQADPTTATAAVDPCPIYSKQFKQKTGLLHKPIYPLRVLFLQLEDLCHKVILVRFLSHTISRNVVQDFFVVIAVHL